MEALFKIFKLDEHDAEKIEASINEPHLHDFEELIIGQEGQLEHFIDFKQQTLTAPFVSFVSKGKIHRVKPRTLDGKCRMWVLRFRSELIPETTFQLYSSFHEDAHVSMEHTECFDRLDIISSIIYNEFSQQEPDLAIIRQLLSSLFTMIEAERRKRATEPIESKTVQSSTFKNFLQLLESYYKQDEGVNFYAEKLFMTARNLNLICHNILQQSVSEIIETRKLTEAKNLLLTTDLTIAEIGYELGFKEKTYFTHVFKKKAGITPTEFRQEMAKLIS
jgi:AraC-like DNA-binding protein